MFDIVVKSGPFVSSISESHVASHWKIYWDGELYIDETVTSGDLTTYTISDPCTLFGTDFQRFPTFRAWVRYKGSATGWGPWGWGAGQIVDILKKTENFDLGPVARNDTSLGIDTFRWKMLLHPDGFKLYRENSTRTEWEYKVTLQDPSNKADIKNFDFTFDQNGRPILVFERYGDIALYWYDPQADGGSGAYVLTDPLCAGTMPVIRMDHRNPYLVKRGETDILLFYYSSGADQFAYRVQGDRYDTEYTIPKDTIDPADKILKFMEYSKDNRLAVVYIEEQFDDYGPCYEFGAILSGRYPFTPDEKCESRVEIDSGHRVVLVEVYNSIKDFGESSIEIASGQLVDKEIKYHSVQDWGKSKINISSGQRIDKFIEYNSIQDWGESKIEISSGYVKQVVIVSNSITEWGESRIEIAGGKRYVP